MINLKKFVFETFILTFLIYKSTLLTFLQDKPYKKSYDWDDLYIPV